MKRTWFLFPIILVFLFSCGKSEDEIRDEKREKIQNKITEFATKNNVDFNLDTLHFKYTMEYQMLTNDNPRILIPNFLIDDIYCKER